MKYRIHPFTIKDPKTNKWHTSGLYAVLDLGSNSVNLHHNVRALHLNADLNDRMRTWMGSIGNAPEDRYNARPLKRGFFHAKFMLIDTFSGEEGEAEFSNAIGDVIREYHCIQK